MKYFTALFAGALLTAGVTFSADKPTVVVILIDDLSHYGVTAYAGWGTRPTAVLLRKLNGLLPESGTMNAQPWKNTSR